MVKNYTVLLLILTFFISQRMASQEIKIFKVDDFDLKGNVKSCLISTKYGKEEYEFNKKGLLTKSVTRFNNVDYDITYYKYSKGMLVEKRFENYRDDIFDKSTSIVNLYIIDTLLNLKITEKIVSYDNEFLDQYEYYYKNNSLRRIIRTNNDGIDEIRVLYNELNGEQTETYEINEVIQKSIRASTKMEMDSVVQRNVLTKNFLNGEPSNAVEEIFDGAGKLMLSTSFVTNEKSKKFMQEKTTSYSYDETGMLSQTEEKQDGDSEIKNFVYQSDVNNNWIKEIITPENSYKTRKISYYAEELEEVKQE
jgi:hypothetical protein